MTLEGFLVVILLLTHVLTAIVGSTVLSTIPKRLYRRKFVILFFCWVVPFFGILLLFKRGQYVPALGANTYQSALKQAAVDYDNEMTERELAKSINYRDSRYGGQTDGYDGGDGGGD